jgi:glutathione S-transferase
MLELFQAEWCPYSSRVRERLTELGVDFVARQVAPYREERDKLEAETGERSIPTLRDGDTVVSGVGDILRYVDERFQPWEYAAEHRLRWREHR